MFEVVGGLDQWYASLWQRVYNAVAEHDFVPGVLDLLEVPEAVQCSDAMHGSLQYFASSIFSVLYSLVEYSPLYT